ncbi:Heavy metal RND efflux outer membrane protein, CzcC family [Arcticibacter svalbardensis MN12-7]|uniref:Heavy metal RND efflux outer membrane protein, CzcC family n=2 Tax=Arcticibacter TaxID=1288026 RepID=R9GQY9_9SPHI|nr:Heavy metal RND efflux outer membrane protein, CzcC family [Arcticibacter svalbardensis MN12-7]
MLQEISANNPSLKVYDSRIKSDDAKVNGAKAWMAPMVGVGTFMTPYPGVKLMDESAKGAWVFSAEQDIPNPVKLKAKAKYQEAQSSVTLAEQAVQANQLKARAKELYFDLLVANKTLVFQRENRAIMQNMKKIAEIRYPYNQGSLSQVFKADGRLYESENMILMTESEIRSKKIAVNTLMYRPVSTEFNVDTSYKVSFNPTALLDTAYLAENRSDIKQMDRSIDVMGLNIKQMQQEAKPDFRIRFEHMSNRAAMMPNQFTLMGMISIPIVPWSSKMYKSEVKSMSFERDAMRQQKEAMLSDMLGMTKSMENDLNNMQLQLTNYERKILPALDKNLKVSMLSYQENKENLNIVIDGWETVNMAQMNYIGQLKKFYQMIVDYEKNIER